MKKRVWEKTLALLLAVCLLMGALPIGADAAVSANTIVANAQSLVGKYPYVYGGESPSEGGFDCSGLVYYVYNKMSGVNITLSQAGRGKAALAGAGSKITGISNFLPGDIVQFNYPHVAIYIGNSTIIEAAKSGTMVRTRKITSSSGVEYAVRLSSITQGGAIVGKTSKPSVSVNGQTVTVSWSYNGSASYIDVYLIQQPWGPEDIKYHQSTTGNSVTFYNVADNGTGYAAYTVARPNPDSYSSEWADGIYVTLAHTTHTWDSGKVTKEATLTEAGIKTYTCTVCGTTKTTEIPKLTSISGSCGTNIKWSYNGNTKTLYISGTGKMPNYNDNPEIPWKTCMVDLKKVEIENGITSIGSNSFYPSPNLTNVSIPSTVTEIGHDAFLGCKSLANVQLPQGLKTIGDFAFAECAQLSSITIPENVTTLGKGVFSACSGLKSVNINCPLRTIDKYTFKRCWSLAKIEIPEGVSLIEEQAFLECRSLQTIMLPSTISTIYSAAFQECTSLLDIYYSGSELDWKSVSVSLDRNTNFSFANFHYAEEENEAGKVLFTDVPSNAYYAQPVAWAVENDITSGTGKGKFSPNASCTRAQAVTFLWNTAGRPEPQGNGSKFVDVKPGSYYEKAVQWAVENNITSGTGNGAFSPNSICTRAQIVTFLYHAANSPAISGNDSFSDVKSGSYYENAVKWAVANNITSGTGNGKFSPANNCVRGQIVTFLYRYAQK